MNLTYKVMTLMSLYFIEKSIRKLQSVVWWRKTKQETIVNILNTFKSVLKQRYGRGGRPYLHVVIGSVRTDKRMKNYRLG